VHVWLVPIRHSTRLGELLLGRYDVLSQCLQSLTFADICNIEVFFPQRRSTMQSLLGYHRYRNVRVTDVPYECVPLPQCGVQKHMSEPKKNWYSHKRYVH
jgi:hypothetical protein